MWKFPLTGGGKPGSGGAEAEIQDKDERKTQIPKAWLFSASCCNLSSGRHFFICLFVFFLLGWFLKEKKLI